MARIAHPLNIPRKESPQKILFRPLQKISWKKCIKATEKKFKYALGHIYVKEMETKGKTKDDIEDVLKIISQIQQSLENRISNNNWMDAETKRKATKKSELIRSLGIMKSLERQFFKQTSVFTVLVLCLLINPRVQF